MGDPQATLWLRQLVERLEYELSSQGGHGADAVLREARDVLNRLRRDANPRTRAQVRAILLVEELLARGELGEAAELLSGELRRSFPGEAQLMPHEIELLRD